MPVATKGRTLPFLPVSGENLAPGKSLERKVREALSFRQEDLRGAERALEAQELDGGPVGQDDPREGWRKGQRAPRGGSLGRVAIRCAGGLGYVLAGQRVGVP